MTHANPLRGLRPDCDVSARVRQQVEFEIVVLAGPEAQQRHSPRSWRSHHGAYDYRQAVDLASRVNSSDEAVNASLDWLAIVTRNEISPGPQVEMVAQALVDRRTLTPAEVKALLARA